jgi:hypothetical protein
VFLGRVLSSCVGVSNLSFWRVFAILISSVICRFTNIAEAFTFFVAMGGLQSMLNEACIRRGLRMLKIDTDVKEVMLLAADRKGLIDMGSFMQLFSWHPRLDDVQGALDAAWKKADKVARSAKAAAANEENNTRRIPGSTIELQALLDQLSRDAILFKSFCPKVLPKPWSPHPRTLIPLPSSIPSALAPHTAHLEASSCPRDRVLLPPKH